MAAKWKISSLFQLALMSSVLTGIDYNEDCEKVLRYAMQMNSATFLFVQLFSRRD
jgi:hypothetical protein